MLFGPRGMRQAMISISQRNDAGDSGASALSDTALRGLPVLLHFISTTALWRQLLSVSHFTEEEIEARQGWGVTFSGAQADRWGASKVGIPLTHCRVRVFQSRGALGGSCPLQCQSWAGTLLSYIFSSLFEEAPFRQGASQIHVMSVFDHPHSCRVHFHEKTM